jgi:hypothetical protein
VAIDENRKVRTRMVALTKFDFDAEAAELVFSFFSWLTPRGPCDEATCIKDASRMHLTPIIITRV